MWGAPGMPWDTSGPSGPSDPQAPPPIPGPGLPFLQAFSVSVWVAQAPKRNLGKRRVGGLGGRARHLFAPGAGETGSGDP